MYPYQHFLACTLLCVILWPIYGALSLIVFLGGFFIDVDHNLWYMVHKRDWRGWKAYRYFTDGVKKEIKFGKSLMIFHTIEFFVVIVVLSFYFKLVLIFLMGLIGHLLMDRVYRVKDNMFDERMFSIIYEHLHKEG
jgi:hypothetical protein